MSNQENQNKSIFSSDAETLVVLNGKDIRDDMWEKVMYVGEIFLAKFYLSYTIKHNFDTLHSRMGYCNQMNLNEKKMKHFMRQRMPLVLILCW